MSFLNPVNEPVLRFSSTDAGAPQINYNARVAGDIKTVLKACLVTGYGAKASAGWTAANETATVIEFVSPSAVMSDYRLGIDDTGAALTTWYYQYQDTRNNMRYNNPGKNFYVINATHANNGWQLLVTKRGMYFVEIVQHSGINKSSTRLTFFGQIKEGLLTSGDINIGFYNVGHSGVISEAMDLYRYQYPYFNIKGYQDLRIFAATPMPLGMTDAVFNQSVIDIVSALYLSSTNMEVVVGELPGMLSKVVNNADELYDVIDTSLNDRPVLKICLGYYDSRAQYANSRGRVMLLRLDNWEY